MTKVSNGKCIRSLSRKSLKASKSRNIIAVLAIALTTVLFTSLFTIAMSINDAFQESNFRQVGGYSHGEFKRLTQEQYNELKEDSLIKEYGLRRNLGIPTTAPFNKNAVEIYYADENVAKWSYATPSQGNLPQENTNEAAADTKVLELLGIEPKIGAEFSVDFIVDGIETTQTFTLCGWWEADSISPANSILIPQSRVDSVINELNITIPGNDGSTGSYNLYIMLESSANIENNLKQILTDHGYQCDKRTEDNYIGIGVNWGYSSTQLLENTDAATAAAIAAILLLIIFTGYLIIYNVFQISVVGDIRFYGLLKTIGTTGRQIKRIIRQQALILSAVGIPIGLILGWLIGIQITPAVLANLNGVTKNTISFNPIIFIFSAVFALCTVILSCSKPGRMAAKVSPIEAVRYTDNSKVKVKKKKTGKGISLFSMASANLGRSRSKTAVTVISLSLAVVLLNSTVTFTNGFDMDKYLSSISVSDFIVANAAYFQTSKGFRDESTALTEDTIGEIDKQNGITESGRIYGNTSCVQEFITEEWYRNIYGKWTDEENLNTLLQFEERDENGKISDDAQLYGMEKYALDKLTVYEGDISKLYEPNGKYIAAVFYDNDNGNLNSYSHWAKLGDIITLRYVEEFEYYNPNNGKIYENPNEIGDTYPYRTRAKKYKDVEYEVAALVSVPSALSYRYYGRDEFILNDQTFIQDTGTSNVMLYAFDASEDTVPDIEEFLSNYTNNTNTEINYESKATYQAEFEGFKNMFLLLGGVLSIIIGLVGILNFVNAVLTGILTRKHEFAILQSIGMTGKQLKTMLIFEGLLYTVGAVFLSAVLSLAFSPLLGKAMNSMLWFFTSHLTITPILVILPIFLLLGFAVPLIVYRLISGMTIVERLRETES